MTIFATQHRQRFSIFLHLTSIIGGGFVYTHTPAHKPLEYGIDMSEIEKNMCLLYVRMWLIFIIIIHISCRRGRSFHAINKISCRSSSLSEAHELEIQMKLFHLLVVMWTNMLVFRSSNCATYTMVSREINRKFSRYMVFGWMCVCETIKNKGNLPDIIRYIILLTVSHIPLYIIQGFAQLHTIRPIYAKRRAGRKKRSATYLIFFIHM